MTKWNSKCRFFNEKYACDTLVSENYTSCGECKFSQEYSKKILIIKLGAIGDVLRTTCILPALRKKFGYDIMIYWMTNPESVDLLKNNQFIDRILPYNTENVLRIQQEEFDILFVLEIDTPSTLLANVVDAKEKLGFYFDNGTTACFNASAMPYLETAFLQHVKLKNRRTYQELISDVCELGNFYEKERPILNLTIKEEQFKENFLRENNLSNNEKIIGVNIGSGGRWQSKFWGNERIKQLLRNLDGYRIILLAGPNEIGKQKEIVNDMKSEGKVLCWNNPNNSLNEFAALVDVCDIVVCGDTMVLHLASALNKKVVALFFVTPPWEIEDYGTTKKIISPLLDKYFFVNEYAEELANSISVEEVIQQI